MCTARAFAWKDLFSKSPLTHFSIAISPYLLHVYTICQLQVLSTRSEVLLSLPQQKSLMDVGGLPKVEKRVSTVAFDRSSDMDDALRYATYFIPDPLRLLIMDCNLHLHAKKRFNLFEFVPNSGQLSQVF